MPGSSMRRLAGMMALVYAVQGSWWPLLAVHLQDLGFSGRARGWAFASFALASLATPLFVGRLADRRFAAERVLASLYTGGAVLLAAFAFGWVTRPGATFVAMLVYWLLMAPAYGLSNSVTFRHLDASARQFGRVRIWGTVGWMVSGWIVSLAMRLRGTTKPGQGTYEAFGVAATLAVIAIAWCLRLPHTPPLPRSKDEPAARDAFAFFKQDRRVVALLCTAFGVSLTTPFVYQVVPAFLPKLGLPRPWIATAMTLGQLSEIGMLLILPRTLNRLGYRGAMALGISAWVGYHGIFALRPPLWLALAAIPLNGVAIANFHIVGPMFLDAQSAPDRRARTQGLYLAVTAGMGNLLGNVIGGELVSRGGGIGAAVFVFPCAVNAVSVLAFLAAFRVERPRPVESGRAA